MSRILAAMGIVSALALGSCMTAQQPAVSDGLAWSFQDNEGEGPKLAYGAPASDHVVLMMTCEPGTERVSLSLLGGSPQAGLVLASGDSKTKFGGEAVASPFAGHMIEADANLSAPPLARFQKTGDLTLIERGRSVELDAKGSERRDVSQFFEACRA